MAILDGPDQVAVLWLGSESSCLMEDDVGFGVIVATWGSVSSMGGKSVSSFNVVGLTFRGTDRSILID